MKQLAPLNLRPKYFEYIEEEINRLFDIVFYQPLIKALSIKELKNTNDPLTEAIASGKIWYENGRFFGEFNASISKRLRAIGAKFNPHSRTWSLELTKLPVDIRLAQAAAQSIFETIRQNILATLSDIHIDSINALSDIPDRYIETINWMEGDFQKTVKNITIPPKLTADQRGIIAAEWGQNLDLYIKNWLAESVLELRQKVQANAFQGRRASQLVETIQQNYGVSKNKAKFLARQETSLLLSKFRETRYKDVGAHKYRWSGTMDQRERPDHKALQNKIYTWDSPPVVDRRTGRRANPGEDFGCRCVAIAIID